MSSFSEAGSPDPLVPYGWGPRAAALLAGHPVPARVVRVDRDRCVVVTAAGETTASTSRHVATPVCVGDWVALEPSGPSDRPWVISHVADRWAVIERADPRSDGRSADVAQVLAANVDLVASVHPLDRPLSHNRIEREVALAWNAGAVPLVVLTKADRHGDPLAAAADLEHRVLGVDVIVTAALRVDGEFDAEIAGEMGAEIVRDTGDGIHEVRRRLRPDRTMMLLGPSGAGKSTLANAIVGDDRLATGGVRVADARGRHTTTARHLVPVPGGGVLLDTPGIRSIGLLGAADGVSVVFGDIEELATRCRFSDCGHDTEPGCAVVAAIAADELDAARLRSWRKLQRELAADRRRVDPLAAVTYREELRRWGKAMKQAKGRSRP